ncbi:MAG: cache domain-containing protein [Deltaproteobacteria bacterium]|nr:cache domain-containing protein [Deltaproteobacteria bacterium]
MLLRIWLALIVVVSGYILTLWFNINSHTNMAYDARKNELQHIVNLAKNTIQPLLEKQNAGLISKEESMREGIEILNRMTFLDSYGNNYIFMTTYDGIMRVIPFEPARQGVSQWDLQDIHGKYLIRELVKLAKSAEGAGFLDYYYLPPGRDVPQKKISYIIGIPEWGAYLGTGMYAGDLERYNQKNITTIVLLSVSTIILIVLSNLILVRPLYVCHRQLRVLFENIRKNPNTAPEVNLSDFSASSEGGKLLSSFKSMIEEVYNSRQELKVSKERFDAILKATNDSIWDWNIATNAVYFSPRWLAMLGYQDNEADLGFSSWRQLIHYDDVEGVLADLQTFLGGVEQGYSRTFRMMHRNGEYRWILSRGHILRDGNGNGYRMIGADTDITEQRHAAATLELQRNELAHISRVAVMGELTATIAHEINQPLAAIGANAHAALRFLAFDEPNLGRVHEILSDIVFDNERAAEVVRRLRAMLIKGKVEASLFDLNTTFNGAIDILSGVAQSRNIKLEKSFSTDLPNLFGDSIQIQQILVNLLLNAIEVFGAEGGEVRVETFKRDDGNVVASVSDTGAAISESDLGKIFEPFYSTKKNGMGMGLSICRTIVEAHGGKIIVECNQPQYVTFAVILPITSGP